MEEAGRVQQEVEQFIAQWQTGDSAMKECFVTLYRLVSTMDSTSLVFVPRPGVSFSLRPRHVKQQGRELFAIIDVIDDDPNERWLSVCFYEDMITDPEERGECIPGGLGGSDGYCFDISAADERMIAYLAARLQEAWSTAAC